MRIGYARVSSTRTDRQDHMAQVQMLKSAGCDQILMERGSGARNDRPVMQQVIAQAAEAAAARLAVQAERLDVEGLLDEAEHMLDPNLGALTQIVEQYKPINTPVIVTDLVRDIDTIAKQVAYADWADSQPGDKASRREIRLVLQKYSLPVTGPLFDQTYAYIREIY